MLATFNDACREFARNVGADNPDRAWILTDFDTWERNPFYTGPAVPYPEDGPFDLDAMTQEKVSEMMYPLDSLPDGAIPF